MKIKLINLYIKLGNRAPVGPENVWWVVPAFKVGKSIYKRLRGRKGRRWG